MAYINLKHAVSKKWQRVTESRYTKAFVITSIIQTIILIFLQIRILNRNSFLYVNVITPSVKNKEDDSCTLIITVSRFMMIITENVMFILFNLYQFYFCLNAIFHQNTMQIFAIVIINIVYVVLGIVQMIDINLYGNKIDSICPGLHLDNNFVLYELPHILVLVTLAILMTTLSWKLYQQFGWNIYKKIGADIEMQRRFKAILIFKMLLKIDLLFVILYNVLILPPLLYIMINSNELNRDQIILVFGSLASLILVIFFQALAYKSMEKEWKSGIFVFVIFWIFVVSDFAYLALKLGVASFIQYGLYSWILLMCNFTICAVLTFVYAIIIMLNFDKGLREYLDKNLPKKQVNGSSNILSDEDNVIIDDVLDIEKGGSSNSNVKKFIIDE
ncbi:hypothetical protein C1645_803935 [Glomus cerebriforme]|uniref:Uncharacterized protein n=1 Tax=Glomus cerebriforme TaxID=658196 RepID=A0A397T5Y7_9GLOM|nr:hypothetical protein C1645_803935 [Glomus cerebriforme]